MTCLPPSPGQGQESIRQLSGCLYGRGEARPITVFNMTRFTRQNQIGLSMAIRSSLTASTVAEARFNHASASEAASGLEKRKP